MRRHFLTPAISAILITILILVSPLVSQEKQEPIVEEVGVNWWLVPVLAVDKSGNPIMDLEAGDLELRVNKRLIKDFTLVKRSMDVEEHQRETRPSSQPKVKAPEQGKRVVVLLIDYIMSGRRTINRSQNLARDIVKNAAPDTRFIVMTIEPLVGLKYVTESIGNKKLLLEKLTKNINRSTNGGPMFESEAALAGTGKFAGQLNANTDSANSEIKLSMNRREILPFLNSFDTLYFYLNGIRGSKFVYFFSSGIPNSISKSIPYFNFEAFPNFLSRNNSTSETGHYNYWIKKAARSLSKAGAVFFMINPMGVDNGSSDLTGNIDADANPTVANGGEKIGSVGTMSGEASLSYLATESGGKYLEGTDSSIITRIRNMHRGFYEVSFRDIPSAIGVDRNISIKSKRKGIKITSIRSIEKSKSYAAMNDLEKEILASNLISPNPLIKRKISAYNATIDKIKQGKSKTVYQLQLPPSFVNKSLDLYKIRVKPNKQKGEAALITLIEKERIKADKNKIQVRFDFSKGKKSSGNIDTYFVLVDPATDTARVHGMTEYDEDPEILALQLEMENALATKKRKTGQTISAEELNRVLAGAAVYCDKLKESAFHFFCLENISETHNPLSTGRRRTTIADATLRYYRQYYRPGAQPLTQVKRHKFTYRLMKQGRQIKEEREPLKAEHMEEKLESNSESEYENERVNPKDVITPTAFFSQKAVFAPITLLDRDRQAQYNYRFLRYDRWNNRRAAVIEAIPKSSSNREASIWGDIWIDTEDFSVLKIQANPASIRGYSQLSELAKKMRTRLQLSLETEFGQLNNGIRFPTKVSSLEKYKGGRIVRYQGAAGWERTRTVFTYSDYRFFNVQSDVTIQ
ncbi:MAG: hypothetical protein GY940_25610 [bacterium]|nr:hypothetical protein [bacterium]